MYVYIECILDSNIRLASYTLVVRLLRLAPPAPDPATPDVEEEVLLYKRRHKWLQLYALIQYCSIYSVV